MKVLITGGSGSLGNALTETLLLQPALERLVIFSRDEYKQHLMQKRFSDKRLRFFLGDVRDFDRVLRALEGIDTVVHAAALKRVDRSVYDTQEFVLTNVVGSMNVINASLNSGVRRALFLGTDKAIQAKNPYGKSKAMVESLWTAANYQRGSNPIQFSTVRYGNVWGSRGSVKEIWMEEFAKTGGIITVTDPEATRFHLTMEGAVNLVVTALSLMEGGEIFIPLLKSYVVGDLARAVTPRVKVKGLTPGEKQHELLIPPDEMDTAYEWDLGFQVLPEASLREEYGLHYYYTRKASEYLSKEWQEKGYSSLLAERLTKDEVEALAGSIRLEKGASAVAKAERVTDFALRT